MPHIATIPKTSTQARGRGRWLRWGLAVLMLTLCVWFLDLGSLLDVLRRVSGRWILLLFVLWTVDRLLMAWKWSVLLRALRVEIPLALLVRFYYQGTFVGTFLPSGLGGDFLRAHWVSRSTGATPQVYAALLMEKMIGFLCAINWALIGTAVLLVIHAPQKPLRWTSVVVASTVMANGLFLISLQPTVHACILRCCSRIPQSRPVWFFQRLYEAYCHYSSQRGALAWNGMLTVAEQALQVLLILAMARSLGIAADTWPFLAVTTIHLLVYRLPIAPDGWGVNEATAIGLYGLIGMAPESAFALAFFAHVIQLVVVLPGLWFLCQSKLPLV